MSVFPIGQDATNLFTDFLKHIYIHAATNTGMKVDEWGRPREGLTNWNCRKQASEEGRSETDGASRCDCPDGRARRRRTKGA